MSKKLVRYTHKKKGGLYAIVIDGDEYGSIKTAGTLKNDGIVIYREVNGPQVYCRTKTDFFESMEIVDE